MFLPLILLFDFAYYYEYLYPGLIPIKSINAWIALTKPGDAGSHIIETENINNSTFINKKHVLILTWTIMKEIIY